jgi:hypothetical protein
LAARLLLGVLALAPAGARASCVPSAKTNWTVPFSIAAMNKAIAVTSYTSGQLTASTSGATVIWSAGGNIQLFSDRLAACPSGRLCTQQPFDLNQADKLGVEIATKASSIKVTLTLESWKNANFSFVGVCDTTTELLYGSASRPDKNNEMFLIQFGTPQEPVGPPK